MAETLRERERGNMFFTCVLTLGVAGVIIFKEFLIHWAILTVSAHSKKQPFTSEQIKQP